MAPGNAQKRAAFERASEKRKRMMRLTMLLLRLSCLQTLQ